MHKILVINPGSTSTKAAIFENEKELYRENLQHSPEVIEAFDDLWGQLSMRLECLMGFLERNGIRPQELSCIMCRGGLLPPVQAGAYLVDETLLNVQRGNPGGIHASNLAGAIGYEIGKKLGIPVYIYDPVSVDEMIPIAKITGVKGVYRKSLSHALNMRAVAQRTAVELGGTYADYNFIVAHLGGGISMSCHQRGRMIDNITDDEGPFSPERCGLLPGKEIAALCEEIGFAAFRKLLRGKGGFISHFGISDVRELEKRIDEGDEKAGLIYEAMAYQVAKGIGSLSTVLEGQVDRIILTGGIAYSNRMTGWISRRVSYLAPVVISPGENEMEALALGGMRVLEGREKASIWAEEQCKHEDSYSGAGQQR